jgi:Superinfection immunity protein
MDEVGALLALLFLGVIYFLPSIVASSRSHHQFGAILVLNLFLGWTFIGWVIALAMAASAVRKTDPDK